MTRFADIGQIKQIIADSEIRELPVFMRDITSLTPLAMLVLSKQIDMASDARTGRVLMKAILTELTKARDDGLIPVCPATEFKLRTPVLTAGEFKTILSRFDLMERKLIVFALGTKMDIVEAAAITRSAARTMANINRWSPEIRELVRSLPANLSCQFLFWKVQPNGKAEHMMDFGSRFKIATKASWGVFAALCENLVLVDTRADSEDFTERFVETAFQ